ncbi:MAG: carboxypeptidase-like regulatory domain-containing protein, partial [Muribaculum sp.]|nr:carboxypeptidase-like regulatory domain-containing protein [Muribaculum sp.]
MNNLLPKHIFYRLLLLWALLPAKLSGATVTLTGFVADSLTQEGLPYVAVFVEGKNAGTMTDENGRFSIAADIPGDSLRFSMMGYMTKKVATSRDMHVSLSPTGVTLKEVIVKPKKEKYSKKNNPAVDFLNRIRRAAPLS